MRELFPKCCFLRLSHDSMTLTIVLFVITQMQLKSEAKFQGKRPHGETTDKIIKAALHNPLLFLPISKAVTLIFCRRFVTLNGRHDNV